MPKITQLILCLLIISAGFTAQAITLNEALINAYITNPELQAQRESLKATDEQIMQALSRWLPTVSVGATKQYNTYKKVGTYTNGKVTGSRDESIDTKSHSITIAQNLFRSGADVASIKLANAQIKQARASLDTKEQEVFLKVVEVYMNVLAAKENYQIAQIKQKDTIRLHIGATQRFKAGDASKTEVALTAAEVEKAKAEKALAFASYETYKASFLAIIGLPADNLVVPDDKITLPQTADEVVKTTLIKNPQIIAAKYNADASKQNIDVKKGNVLPEIALQHKVSDDTASGYSSSRGLRNHTTIIQLTLPVFAVSNWSQLRQTKREAAQAQNSMNNIIQTIRASAIQSWANLNSYKISLKAGKTEYTARKLAYEGGKAQEKAGLISTLDIITYQNDYFTAYRNFIVARSKYYTSLYTLKSIIGECTARTLRLNTKYYDPLKNYNSIKWQLIGAF